MNEITWKLNIIGSKNLLLRLGIWKSSVQVIRHSIQDSSIKVSISSQWIKAISTTTFLKKQRPLVLPANKTSGRDLAKTFGYNTDGCFKNIPHWKSESTKFIKKKNIMDLETRERDPYFLNFIRDEIIDDMPDYKSQKDTCMPKHYETVKSQTVIFCF